MNSSVTLILGLLTALIAVPVAVVAQDGSAQAPAVRDLDVTAVENGWGVGQAAAVGASMTRHIVIVSYLDPQQTRALYDLTLPFTQPPYSLPITGLIRSPAAPKSVTATPNPLQYDIYFYGAMFPRDVNPDKRFSRRDHLDATIRAIHRHYFAPGAPKSP